MKHVNYFILVTIVLAGSVGCKKSFLNVKDNTALIRDQYVADLRTAQEYLNGIYVMLGRDFYGGLNEVYPDLVADNIKPTPANISLLNIHYAWKQIVPYNNDNSNMLGLWRTGYLLIRSCSFIIGKAGELNEENPVKAKQMQAEAYGIRAWVHFILVNTFAQSYNFTSNGNHPGVPYISSSDWTDPFRRNTVAEVYDGMINDLKQAITLSVPGTGNTLVMNQNAAKALLARVYLFKEDWQQAKALATEVATAVPLLPTGAYPAKLFTREETEALFQLAPFSTNIIPSPAGYTTAYQGVYFRSTHFLATKDIADLLTQNPNDVRKSWISPGGIGSDSIRKYPINVVPGFGTSAVNMARSYYQTLLRSSEMFLTVAEASAKTGDEATAKTYLDAIRKRADPTATSSTATGAALLDAIYLERRKELAFECLRMYDLLRWKKGVNRADVQTGAPAILPYPSDKAIAPIPAVDAANGVPQNPSY